MNLKRFLSDISEEWEIDTEYSSLKYLYDEILFEMQEYADDTAHDFVVLNDKTVYQILVVLKTISNIKESEGAVINDLKKLAEN